MISEFTSPRWKQLIETREAYFLICTFSSRVGMTTSSRPLICMMGWSAGMGIPPRTKQGSEKLSTTQQSSKLHIFNSFDAFFPSFPCQMTAGSSRNHWGALTLLGFVPAGVHVGQGDVGIAQTLHPFHQLASLLPDHVEDHLGFVRALLQHRRVSVSESAPLGRLPVPEAEA